MDEQERKRMMDAFEAYLGPYEKYNDGTNETRDWWAACLGMWVVAWRDCLDAQRNDEEKEGE